MLSFSASTSSAQRVSDCGDNVLRRRRPISSTSLSSNILRRLVLCVFNEHKLWWRNDVTFYGVEVVERVGICLAHLDGNFVEFGSGVVQLTVMKSEKKRLVVYLCLLNSSYVVTKFILVCVFEDASCRSLVLLMTSLYFYLKELFSFNFDVKWTKLQHRCIMMNSLSVHNFVYNGRRLKMQFTCIRNINNRLRNHMVI